MSGQQCKSKLAHHSIKLQYYTNVDGWARRSSFVKYIINVSYNVSNVFTDQHCSTTLAQHYVYRFDQYYVNVEWWARTLSFVKYKGTFSHNDSNVVPGMHCSSTLAHHSIYLLKTVLYECWWLTIIIRQIYTKHFLQQFKCCARSALHLITSTTFDLSFKTVLYECWLLSAPIIIRQI